ncbi:MAG: arsenic-transporting ATPase [Candidatus Aenigmatarchaeota archaeon]|nr:MAG: arsenic-transporting ATPase [Candidatus Aenigmarchaeota archaeon]
MITKYEFFGGKGGVGKTTMAAARALWLSKKGYKVLIISTDPAHSLSDSFEKRIDGEVKKIGKNLYGVEIDPEKAVQEYREKMSAEMEQLEMLGLGEEMDLASMTPGIDEMAAFDRFMRYMDDGDYDYVIFDTAPTGHTLRFLSLPEIMNSWIGKIIKIRMRFSQITGMFKKLLPFGDEEERDTGLEILERMKERITRAREVMKDPQRTTFTMVMIPEEMSIFETERAMESLEDYSIPVKRIIVNQIIPENPHCEFCRTKRKQQMDRLKRIKKSFKDKEILEAQMFEHEIKGMKSLERLGRLLYGEV